MSTHGTTTGSRLVTLAATLLVTCIAVLLPGVPASAQGHQVNIQGYAFSPASFTLEAGDTVTWTNFDTAPHDVAVTNGPASFHSPLLSRGQSWSFTFRIPGSYSYVCSVHPDMASSLVVIAPAPAAVPASRHHKIVAKKPAAPASRARTHTVAVPALNPAQQTNLKPLLLVSGTTMSIVKFCLLLLVARPSPVVADRDRGTPEPSS